MTHGNSDGIRVTFTDKYQRLIIIEEDGCDVVATHNGRRVGSIEFDHTDGDPYLFGMDVEATYRRAGIATAMMKLAAEIYGKSFDKPSFTATGCDHADSHTYYTQEGAAFIRSCLERGILDDTERHDDGDLREW